jgi:hypothetical protein
MNGHRFTSGANWFVTPEYTLELKWSNTCSFVLCSSTCISAKQSSMIQENKINANIPSATPSSSTPGFLAHPKSMSLTTNSLSPLRSVVLTNTLSALMSFSKREESIGKIIKKKPSPDARCRGYQDERGRKAARAKPGSKYLYQTFPRALKCARKMHCCKPVWRS